MVIFCLGVRKHSFYDFQAKFFFLQNPTRKKLLSINGSILIRTDGSKFPDLTDLQNRNSVKTGVCFNIRPEYHHYNILSKKKQNEDTKIQKRDMIFLFIIKFPDNIADNSVTMIFFTIESHENSKWLLQHKKHQLLFVVEFDSKSVSVYF